MNRQIRAIPLHMLLLAGLLPLAPTALAQDTPPAPTKPQPRPEPSRREVAFLGIETVSVDAATRRRLKLTEGTGLRVQFVAPQSPSNGKLQAGDVLVQLDDQVLCNHDQLRSLIRAKKPGDTVTLKLYRDGEALDLKIKLTGVTIGAGGGRSLLPSHNSLLPEVRFRIEGQDIPLRDLLEDRIAQYRGRVITIDPDTFKDLPDEARATLREMQKNLQKHLDNLRSDDPGKELPKIEITPDDSTATEATENKTTPVSNFRSVQQKFVANSTTTNSTTWMRDRDGSICLTNKDGCRCARIEDASGKVIFDGPVETADQRAAMPETAAKRLEILEQLSGSGVQPTASISIKTE